MESTRRRISDAGEMLLVVGSLVILVGLGAAAALLVIVDDIVAATVAATGGVGFGLVLALGGDLVRRVAAVDPETGP
jgi:hypothetical protein